MSWTFRGFTAADLDDAVAAASREGWTASRVWFAAIVAHDPDLCFVAESPEGTIGMVTATCFGESGWVGNLIVDPACRRRGLGEELMRRAIAALEERGIRTLRLDADPPGINIYRRLGFADEQLSRRFRLDSEPPSGSTACLPPLESVSRIAALDRRVFGDDRSRLLSLVLPHAASSAVLGESDDARGFVLAIPAGDGVTLGPCVAEDANGAAALLRACLRRRVGGPVTAGCLESNPQAADLFLDLGFRETAPSVRMVRGDGAATAGTTDAFAMAHGAVG